MPEEDRPGVCQAGWTRSVQLQFWSSECARHYSCFPAMFYNWQNRSAHLSFFSLGKIIVTPSIYTKGRKAEKQHLTSTTQTDSLMGEVADPNWTGAQVPLRLYRNFDGVAHIYSLNILKVLLKFVNLKFFCKCFKTEHTIHWFLLRMGSSGEQVTSLFSKHFSGLLPAVRKLPLPSCDACMRTMGESVTSFAGRHQWQNV